MDLALFDFDGTLSCKDSYLLFTKYLSRKRFLGGCLLLAPRIFMYMARVYPNYKLKEDFLTSFYRGNTAEDLQTRAERFCIEVLPSIIRPKGLERLLWHRERGDTTAVVSASPRLILEPWCRRLKIDIIGTELEVDSRSKVTGKIAGINCWGEEKVRRIRSRYALQEYGQIFAYGDSNGDLPMLNLAERDRQYYKPFR